MEPQGFQRSLAVGPAVGGQLAVAGRAEEAGLATELDRMTAVAEAWSTLRHRPGPGCVTVSLAFTAVSNC